MKIKLVSDSTPDLPLEFLKENNVEIVPIIITFKEDEYLDLLEINSSKLYSLVEEKKVLPKTSARSVGYFMDVFQRAFDEGYEQVVCITISSLCSSTYQNALMAAQEFAGKVFVHDSLNLSSGEGLQLLKALELIKQGLSGQEILDQLKEMTGKVRSQFAIESLDYLHKGGRCSQTSYYLGKSFKIKPIIRVVDGKMIVYKKALGKMRNALDKLLEIIKEDLANLSNDKVVITHSLANESLAYLKEELAKIVPEEKIMVTDAGCAISTHCGKGTIGIIYSVN